jgi:hypothetical protein
MIIRTIPALIISIIVVYFFLLPWYITGIESESTSTLPITKPNDVLHEVPSTTPSSLPQVELSCPEQTCTCPEQSCPEQLCPTYSSSPPSPTAGSSSSPASPTDAAPSHKGINILTVGQALESTPLFTSPNGRYNLTLQPSGQLSLWDTYASSEVFASNTALYWPVTFSVVLAPNGLLELTWKNEKEEPYSGKPWSSVMLPDCDGIDPKTDEAAPVLELLDSGLLHIRSGEKTVCTLHKATQDHGRLAIVYAGYLRTYLQTCEGHMSKLVKPWTGSGGVDIHIYGYMEEVFHTDTDHPTREEIEGKLRECFGENLKTVTLVKEQVVEEHWTNASEGVLEKTCHNGDATKLDHHLNQYKMIWDAGRQMRRYMMQEGIRYDYILKTRLDLILHGEIPPLSELVDMVQDGSIVAPRVALDRNWYMMLHYGELVAGVSDIMAFGKASSMYTYLNLYEGWKEMITLEREEGFAKWSGHITHVFDKHARGDVEKCTPEESLAYWLGLYGIEVKTDWRFEMGLLRNQDGAFPRLGSKLGRIIFTCPEKGRKWLCPVW